ncbi:MAG TPA: TIR domain-containing protein [Mucilaginibacter sp.]|jgi:hypothetical protein|nr:TIR domain-containing protein [Mucilaginibacter sp.]
MEIPKNAAKLDLSYQGLTEIPQEVFACKNLKKLNLSHNKLKVLPKELSQLKFLKNLDVSHNEIKVLYAKSFDLKNLEILILNYNKLKQLPGQIEQLSKLKKLSLANNLLEELPDVVFTLQNLTALDISSNRFKLFPFGLFNIKTLEKLWLGKNIFNEFPSEGMLREMTGLKYLYCFSAAKNSINSVDNDYNILQQIKGNSLDALRSLVEQPQKTTSMLTPNKKHIFINYSHRDTEYRDEIEVSLNVLKQLAYKFEFWSDTKLEGGDVWRKEIEAAIDRASIAINIVSRYYMASKFINEVELPAILKKAKNEGTLVLTVVARKCLFTEGPLGEFQSINEPNNPIEGEAPSAQQNIYTLLETRIKKFINGGK